MPITVRQTIRQDESMKEKVFIFHKMWNFKFRNYYLAFSFKYIFPLIFSADASEKHF